MLNHTLNNRRIPGLKRRHKQSGFTLIEMAVVLVIVGLLLGSFIGTFVSRVDATRRDNTKKELEEIKRVIIAYAYNQGAVVYLPCPDTSDPPDGLEDRLAGVCSPGGIMGTVPWQTLGLGREDAWATHYRYWVNEAYATALGFDLTADDTNASNATIRTRVNDVNTVMVQNAVAVIFSHGKNTLGGIGVNGIDRPDVPVAGSDDENENDNGGQVYVARPPSETGSGSAGGVFDDIVVWINSYEVKAKLVDAGKLP